MDKSRYGHYRPQDRSNLWHRPNLRRWFLRGLVGLFIIAAFLLWQWSYSEMSTYLEPNGKLAAKVHITTTRIPHLLSVQLTDGNSIDDTSCYVKQGGTLKLQGDDINLPSWLNILGLHSGYKLTRLEGCYTDPMLRDKGTVFILNNGEDNFFTTVQGQKWLSWIVAADYSKPLFLPTDLQANHMARTYDVITTQKGFHLVMSK